MNEHIWPWLAHIDISPREAVSDAEELFGGLVTDHDARRFGPSPAVLQQLARKNHFEIIGRLGSEDSYDDYRSSPVMMAARRSLAPLLASPFDARLYRQIGEEEWPEAKVGDLVVLTQLELEREQNDTGLGVIGELMTAQRVTSGCRGHALLHRLGSVGVLEVVSVWLGQELLDDFSALPSVQRLHTALSSMLAAPRDERSHQLIVGGWKAE